MVIALSAILGMQSSDYSGGQVIAPLLIILRVANQRALTSETIMTGNIDSMRFNKSHEESTDGVETIPDERPAGSIDSDGETQDSLDPPVGKRH